MTEDEQRAQWQKIDALRDQASAITERVARVEGRADSIEQRLERQRATTHSNREEAHKEFEAIISEIREVRSHIDQARGGLRIGRIIAYGLLAIAGAVAALKSGDMSGAWHSLTSMFRG